VHSSECLLVLSLLQLYHCITTRTVNTLPPHVCLGQFLLPSVSFHFPTFYSIFQYFLLFSFSYSHYIICFLAFLFLHILPEYSHSVFRLDVVGGYYTWLYFLCVDFMLYVF